MVCSFQFKRASIKSIIALYCNIPVVVLTHQYKWLRILLFHSSRMEQSFCLPIASIFLPIPVIIHVILYETLTDLQSQKSMKGSLKLQNFIMQNPFIFNYVAFLPLLLIPQYTHTHTHPHPHTHTYIKRKFLTSAKARHLLKCWKHIGAS